MALTDFTEYDEVRAILGVSAREIEDKVLALKIYERELQFLLAEIAPTLETTYLALANASTRTTPEQKFVDIVQVFSAYAVSKSLLTSLPLFAPRRIQDGRAEQERVQDPFPTLRDDISMAYSAMLERLNGALGSVGLVPANTTSRAYFSTSSLTVDPVIA